MNITKESLRTIRWKLLDLYWRFYGKQFENPGLPADIGSFLFVCKGNICRSPFSEHLMRSLLSANGRRQIQCRSAGLEVTRSLPSPEEAVLAAKDFDVFLGDHRSKRFEVSMLQSFSMIFVMEAGQLKVLRKAYPAFKDKFFLLPLFEHNFGKTSRGYLRYNLEDPYGRALEDFQACYHRIQKCLEGVFRELSISPQ